VTVTSPQKAIDVKGRAGNRENGTDGRGKGGETLEAKIDEER